MLWTLPFMLFAIWVLGLLTPTTLGGSIHVLLIAAVLVILLNVTRSRKAQRAGIRR
ncbi:MAG TPA: lmo0937 family membrane protein [Candidatus Limnocylindria bacterium]|nr:lmo0937 family membrane protein [Candidatus Limnocylindria bacterium]